MRIALAQLNPTVGDIAGNTQLVLDAIHAAAAAEADVLMTSELVLVGYPPRDLLLRQGVVEACEAAVQAIAAKVPQGLTVLLGHPRREDAGTAATAGSTNRPLRNSASVLRDGRVELVYDKRLLPGYDVFDEDRYFQPPDRSGRARPAAVTVNGRLIGLLICEDLWQGADVQNQQHVGRRYAESPVDDLAAGGCDMLISLNASPFVLGKFQRHVEQLQQTARSWNLPIAMVNQVGANDDLIFDGRSCVVDARGSVRLQMPGWVQDVQIVDIDLSDDVRSENASSNAIAEAALNSHASAPEFPQQEEEIFRALVLGIADYFRKTNHSEAMLGLSGGVDSAVVAALAAAALGPEHVRGYMMPSQYSSQESRDDAIALAANLGMAVPEEIPIHQMHEAVLHGLAQPLGELTCSVTDENIQSRLRGLVLMAISNASGGLVLSTSNKSEAAVGYTTLYGDMCGAIAPLADLVKTRIYGLAHWMNDNFARCGFDQPPIPESTMTKPPSAELRPNQTDQDTLPPYDVLDQIIVRYVEQEQSVEQIIEETGFQGDLVRRFCRQIDREEYKRKQSSIVLKLTARAFGPGRPMPIAMQYTRLPAQALQHQDVARRTPL